jgi:hypothetical protein
MKLLLIADSDRRGRRYVPRKKHLPPSAGHWPIVYSAPEIIALIHSSASDLLCADLLMNRRICLQCRFVHISKLHAA